MHPSIKSNNKTQQTAGNGKLILLCLYLFYSRFSSDPGGSDNENVSISGDRMAAVGGGNNISVNRSKSASNNSSKRLPGGGGVDSNQSNDSTSSSSGTGVSGSLSERQRSRSSRSHTGPPMGDPNGRILGTLLEQINLLHETNSKICRNLHDTKGKKGFLE